MSARPRFTGEWRERALGRFGNHYGGLTGKTKDDFGEGNAEYISFLDILENVRITPHSFARVRIARTESQNRVRQGDVLFNGTSETAKDLAMGSVVAFLANDLYLNSFCFGFRISDSDQCDPLFLAYSFRGKSGRAAMHGLAQGATRYNLSKRQFLAVRISLPPLPEQRAIAAVLSDVDDSIQSLEALVAKKRAIKQGAMRQMLTGRTRLPGFTGVWALVSLGSLGKFRKGKGIKRDEVTEVGFPCIRYGELYTRYWNYVVNLVSRIPPEIALTSSKIEDGELLFSGSGETADEIGICVAYVGDEPAYAGGDIIIFSAPGQDSVFLAHLLNAPEAACQKARMAQGDAVVHLRSDHLAGVHVHLPPLLEQRAIAAVLTDMDDEIAALEARLAKTRAIRRGMMQQLLTGAIRLPIPERVVTSETHDA